MHDREVDERVLRACARTLGVEPGGRLCPDIESLAARDDDLHTKVKLLCDGIGRRVDEQVVRGA